MRHSASAFLVVKRSTGVQRPSRHLGEMTVGRVTIRRPLPGGAQQQVSWRWIEATSG
jgi:hypothetical protein